jgi:prefoldin subunit 5
MVIKNLTVIEINAALMNIQKQIETLRQAIENLQTENK